MSIAYALLTAVFVFFVSLGVFTQSASPTFWVLLYVALPLLIYGVTVLVTVLAQYSACDQVRMGDVATTSVPSAVMAWGALLLSSFSWFRLPIASVVAPLFLTPEASANGKTCCTSTPSLKEAEDAEPMIRGAAHAFYLFFSTLFGVIISCGFSTMC
jgi:hypothetical protein